MLKADAQSAIIREWLLLSPPKRATEHQAFLFAIEAMQRYHFSCKGDPYQHIKGWLIPYVGRD
jgi:hypothetical protein